MGPVASLETPFQCNQRATGRAEPAPERKWQDRTQPAGDYVIKVGQLSNGPRTRGTRLLGRRCRGMEVEAKRLRANTVSKLKLFYVSYSCILRIESYGPIT